MALTQEDKNDIRGIVREEVQKEVSKAIREEVSKIVQQEVEPLRDMLESNDRKLDAMVELFSPLLYDRHRISDFKMRVDRVESDVAELRRQVV